MSLRGRQLVPYMAGSYDEGSHYQGNDGRLLQRERTSQVLVDRAKRLNDEFLVTLSNPGNILQAAEAKALLKEHIQTITTTVATLSKDIEVREKYFFKFHLTDVDPGAHPDCHTDRPIVWGPLG